MAASKESHRAMYLIGLVGLVQWEAQTHISRFSPALAFAGQRQTLLLPTCKSMSFPAREAAHTCFPKATLLSD